MKRISRINRYMAVLFANISLIIACECIAKADAFKFVPAAPTETNSLHHPLDDEVSVHSGINVPIHLNTGDSITWHYIYTGGGQGYVVLSTDQADIQELRLFGNTFGGGTSSKVELQFSDSDGKLIGKPYIFNVTWGANSVLVSNDNDVLGNLQPLGCISDFELKVTITAGQVDFTGANFVWEAGDIEPCPEPMSMLLLGTGLTGVAINMRRRLKNRKSKQGSQ